MKNSGIFLFLLIFSVQLQSQTNDCNFSFSAIFYNVENLYDTIDDANTNDDDFVPNSPKKWNTFRYYEKLKHITQVIVYAGKWQIPDLIGLSEVENRNCLWALTHSTNLSRFQYEIIQYDSPDKRGIDVALLYNPKTFRPINSKPIRVDLGTKHTTRDILYVSGNINAINDTLHVFVCHFPSRFGGKASSESKRILAAKTLKHSIDSILAKNVDANIVIMGDFNDGPTDIAISEVLAAKPHIMNESLLVTIIDTASLGTHFYKNEWEFLDQSIVSKGLIQKYAVQNSVVHPEFISDKQTDSGILYPKRTYRGNYYHGGYSDHYPIKILINCKVK